jgi:long-chain acyl-CoA synthetase
LYDNAGDASKSPAGSALEHEGVPRMAFDTFWSRAVRRPNHVALIEPDHRTIKAGELLASANQLVHGLRNLGLRRGDVIAAVLPSSVEAYELYLAMQQAGWYLVPINYHLVGPEIAYILQDCEARIFVAHERYAEACAAAVEEAGFPLSRAFAVGAIAGFQPYGALKDRHPSTTPADRSLGSVMNYTSGTTGRPKGVRRDLPGSEPEETDLGAALVTGYRVDPDATDDVHLLACPWYHTAPLIMSVPSLHLGHTVVIMDRFDPARALDLIDRHRVTLTHLVPTQFVRLLALPEDVRRRYDTSSLRHVIHGAAPCAPDVKRRMIEWWGPVLDEYYASTEGVGGTIIFSDEWLAKPGSVGKPRTPGQIVILDEEGNRLPPGQIGTIYSIPRTAWSYYKDAEKTERAKHGEYATVGDVGYLDEDGYLYLSDRKTDMIISGGVNIYPAEVEMALFGHPKVLDVAVFGIPNDEWGEEVKAVVAPQPGADPGDTLTAELLGHLEGRIARYKVPRSIDYLPELPRDPSGKLYKRMLREPYWAGSQRSI